MLVEEFFDTVFDDAFCFMCEIDSFIAYIVLALLELSAISSPNKNLEDEWSHKLHHSLLKKEVFSHSLRPNVICSDAIPSNVMVYMWCVARFDAICKISKIWKTTMEER